MSIMIALAVMQPRARALGTAARFQSANANGWSATYATPPTFSPDTTPEVFTVTRAGYDATGTVISLTENLTCTQRLRQPYPNQAVLAPDQVALSDYIYATDSITGVTNNSTEVSPKPICNWVMPHRAVVGNTVTLEIVAFHRNARNREQVACVQFSVTDGTTTVTQNVTTSVVSGRAGDQGAVIVYQAAVDISTLANPATITCNAKVYPWIGGAASVADSSLASNLREFSPRFFRRDTTLAANPVFVYVDATTGVDATGAVSTTATVASAAPCLTIVGAINRAVAVNGQVDGVVIRLKAGTHLLGNTTTTRTQTYAELLVTRDPSASRASVIMQFGAGSRLRLGATQGFLRFTDITIQRTGVSNISGETTSPQTLMFDNLDFDNGSNNATVLANSHGHWFGVNITNAAASLFTAGTYETRILRGVTLPNGGSIEPWLVVGCLMTNCNAPGRGTRTSTGSIWAFNQSMKMVTTGALGYGATENVTNIAIVQNVFEFISATSNPALQLSNDSNTGSNTHVVVMNNTYAGAFNNGRGNLFYEDGTTPRTSKLHALKANIHVQVNTKGDVFRGINEAGADASTRLGNWAYLYGVGCQDEWSQFIDANSGGLGTSFAQAYPGLHASLGTSATVRNDPLFTTNQATTPGPVAGTGGGTYSLQAGSPCKARVPGPTLRFDLAGTARAATNASAGAYE